MDVWLDTSYCLPNHPDRREQFARLIREAGPGRVLFGTDSPWAEQAGALDYTRAFLADYNFSVEEQAAILGENARKILFD